MMFLFKFFIHDPNILLYYIDYIALNYIINDFVFPLWNTDSSFEMITMAVNVLESSIKLVERVSKGKIIIASVFMDLLIFLLGFATNQQNIENPEKFEYLRHNYVHFEVIFENGTFEKVH